MYMANLLCAYMRASKSIVLQDVSVTISVYFGDVRLYHESRYQRLSLKNSLMAFCTLVARNWSRRKSKSNIFSFLFMLSFTNSQDARFNSAKSNGRSAPTRAKISCVCVKGLWLVIAPTEVLSTWVISMSINKRIRVAGRWVLIFFQYATSTCLCVCTCAHCLG